MEAALSQPSVVCQPKPVRRNRRALAPAWRWMQGDGEVSMVAVVTVVLWSFTAVVGFAGLCLGYRLPIAPAAPEMPAQAEVLAVELTHETLPPLRAEEPSPTVLTPPAMAEPLTLPAEIPLTVVAETSAAIAFPRPVEGPVRNVNVPEAAPGVRTEAVAAETSVAAPVTVQALTYGQGDGRQPAPDYPYQAVREGQEGVVRVRFTVGENGRVHLAEAVAPSPWPLLNQSAVRAVRERWRFRAGAVRAYEVSIRFTLTR